MLFLVPVQICRIHYTYSNLLYTKYSEYFNNEAKSACGAAKRKVIIAALMSRRRNKTRRKHVAVQQLPWRQISSPYSPMEVLTPEQVNTIIESALDVLEQHGMRFLEGESRKIGRVFIPKHLAMAMKEGICVRVNCSIETRIKRIIEDYPVADENSLTQIEQILNSLRRKMGNTKIDRLCTLLRKGNFEELVRTLLLDYYDKRYSNSMSDYSYELELSSEDISEAAAELEGFRASLISSGEVGGRY
jgi:hypothetical protein